MSGVRRWRIALAVVVGLLSASCSGIPSEGQAEVVRTVEGPQNLSEPLTPQSGQAPDQVIRGFIAASADNRSDQSQGKPFAAARPFLTARAAEGWQPAKLRIVVVGDDYTLSQDKDDASTYTLVAQQVGALAVDKSYTAARAGVDDVKIHVVEVDGEWRIDVPPTSLVITASDFSANYLERPVYFLNSTGTNLVPDLRYLPRSSTEAVRADRLVSMLLAGPSARLTSGVTSMLSGGVKLAANVVIDSAGVVQVDLSGVVLPTDLARQALAAQLAWTVRSEGTVAITIDGTPLDRAQPDQVYSAGTTNSFDPDTTPATGQPAARDPYYLDSSGRIVSLVSGKAMWGEWGTRGGVQSAAMSAASVAVAAVVADGASEQLRIGRPLDRSEGETTVLTAQTLTQPSWDRFGNEVWVVQNGDTNPQVIRLTISGQVAQQVVQVPGLDKLGKVTALQLSPDGVRVALVADASLYIGTIQRIDQEGSTRVQVVGLTELSPALPDVGPVAFRSATELLLGTGQTLVSVSIDGREITPGDAGGIFDVVRALAIDDEHAYISFGGRIWELSGSLQSGEWVSPDPKIESFYGTGPFLPN